MEYDQLPVFSVATGFALMVLSRSCYVRGPLILIEMQLVGIIFVVKFRASWH